jgi:TP901 family phage tail tape measure protein
VSDVNARIGIDFDTAGALGQLRRLQAGLSKFHQTLAEGNLAAANAQKGLNAALAQSIAANGKFAVSQKAVATSTLAFTTALEKNKLSLKEYFRYSAAAATANTRTLSRMFAQEREIINRARRDRVKALQSQYIQMAKAQGGFVNAMRIMPRTLMMANGQFTELGTRIQYAAQRQQFLNQLLRQGSTQLLNFGKNTQWAGRQLMVGLTIPLAMLGGYAAKSFRELEKEIIKFRRVYGDAFTNEAETNAAVENVRTIANEYVKFGVAVKDTMAMAADAAAAGFQGRDLEQQIKTASKLAVLGQVEQQQALETTISLQTAFGLSSDQLAEKINFLNAVENQTLLSIEDLTIAIPKAAPVVKQLGGTVEDLAFFLTAMKEGGINASQGANALKSGLASLINPTEKASKMLADMGVNINGIVEANQGDIKGVVVGFARALDELDPLTRARAIEQLFGKFQFARLSTLFQNVVRDGSQASRAFDLAGASIEELAVMSEREMKKIEEATGFKFQAAMEQFKQDIMPLGKAFLEALTPVVKFFSSLLEKFNGLSDGTKKVFAVVTAVLAGIGPIALMTFGLVANGVANLIKLFAVLRGGIAKLNGQNKILGGGFDYVTQQELENQAASQALHNTHTRLTEVFNVEKVAIQQLSASYGALSTQMRALAAQNPGLFMGGAAGARTAVKGLPPVKKYADGVISVPGPKGAGDVVPAMVSPGEAIIPAKTSQKYRGLITAMFQDKVPGFSTGRLPWGNAHPTKQTGPIDLKGPKSFAETQSQRLVADQIDKAVKSGRFGKMKPTDFGTLVQPFSGRSFPIPGVGGVYRKPDGKMVVVKPTMDEKTALAEVRATEIARKVHGLVSPKQTIKTMMDPTDPARKRKIIVLESPYDNRIAESTGKFTQKEMTTQLVASTLRADKDLSPSNVFGKVLADPGTAGVFARASGFRDYQTVLPGMGEMGMINLLGVKGGAKKFFAQETSALAAKMTPKQYEQMIVKEIDKSLPKLRKLIDSWNLNPVEKQVYENMYARLDAGKKVDWQKLHSVHVAAGQKVPKYEVGLDPSQNERSMQRALSKYMVAESQMSRISSQLVNDFDNEFARDLERLKSTNPDRAAQIEKAWKGQGSFQSARQSQFAQVLKDMVPVKVGDQTLYVSKADMDKFSRDPDNQIKHARTKEHILERGLYRMGLRPDASGRFVGGGDLSKSRALNASAFAFDLQTSNKGAGGGSSLLSKTVRAIADEERKSFLARRGDSVKTRAGQLLSRAGYADADIRYLLRPELSHLQGHQLGERQGSQSMKTGFGMYDARIVNDYMRRQKSPLEIVNWNKKQMELLAAGKKGNPFLNVAQINEYQKAAEFMSKGRHPINATERALVARSAQLDQLALEASARGNKIPKRFLSKSSVTHMQALQAVLDPGSTIKPGRLMDLSAAQSGKVLVAPGEIRVNNKTGEVSIVRGGQSAPSGAQRLGGSPKDTILGDEKKYTYYPRGGGVRPVPLLPGRITGTPGDTTVKNPTVRQGNIAADLRSKGYSQSEIDKILKKLAKKELRIKETQTAASEKAARTEAYRQREQANVQKKSAEASKKAFAEQVRRDKLNYAYMTNYDAAVKEGQDRELKAKKQSEKKAAQDRRMASQERVGRFSGGMSMALGTAGMAAMFSGNTGMGMGLMGASAVAGMAPMLMNPYVAAGAAALALGGTLIYLNKKSRDQAEATSKLVDATTSTTARMARIGEITNKVGASEIMSKRRNQQASDRFVTGFERGKQPFGTTFLESEVGKEVFEGIKENIVRNGAEVSAQQMSIQLAGYVSDGILSAEQAHSVAEAIGLNLRNTALGAKISAELLDLIGPSGEDLLKNPLEVRVNLVNAQRDVSEQISGGLANNLSSYNTSAENLISQASKIVIPGIGPMTALGGLLQGTSLGDRLAPGFLQYSAAEMFTQTAGEAMASGAAAYGAQNLEFNQAQIDSLNLQYEKEIAILEKQKASTTDKAKQAELDEKIAKLKSDQESQSKELRLVNKDIMKDQLASFKVAQQRGAIEDAFFDSLKSQVKTKWADDPMTEAFLKQAANLDSKELEVIIDTVVASGQLSPMAATSLMTMFAEDEKGLQKTLNAALKYQDPGKFMEIVNFFSGMDPKVGKKNIKMLVKMSKENPEQADKLMSSIALLQKMDGKEVDLKAFFEGEDATERLNDLADSLQAVEDHKGPFTLKALTEVEELGGVSLEGILERWSEFENLDDETKKTVIQEYVTLHKFITDDAIDSEIAQRIDAAGGASTVADYYRTEAGRESVRQYLAADRTMQRVRQDIESNAASSVNTPNDGSKKNPFADILARLKNVRNAAINAAGGFKELQKAIAASGDKSVADKFVGIEQQMMKQGLSRDFINYITGLDPQEQKKFGATATKAGKRKYKEFDYETGKMQTRTVKFKKGDFVLTEKGNTMRQAFDKAVVGEFQLAQKDLLKSLKEQEVAYKTLKGLGLSNLEIEKAMENQAYVTAIATGEITKKELQTNAALQKQALLREQIKSITDKTQQSETRISALQKAPDLINFLSQLKTIDDQGNQVSLSITSIYDAIQDPEDLISMVAIMEAINAGTLKAEDGFKQLFDFINNAEVAKDLEKNLMTPLERFQKAYDAAMKVFDAYRTMDQYTLKSQASGFGDETGVSQFNSKNFKQLERLSAESNETLAELNAQLAIYEHQISMIRSEIEQIERSIENMDVAEFDLTVDGKKVTGKLKYVLEDLKEQISDWEREIEMQYERPIKTLQDESNILSNDLEVMDYQAKKINDTYEDQAKALEEVQKVNESIIRQQEQQLDLADALTQGDIAAAARAAQDMRASSAEDFATSQSDVLGQARENAIDALTNAQGMTREQIEERRWQISREIYALENDPTRLALEKSIQEAKDAIYTIEEKREDKLLKIREHEERIYQIEQDKIFPLQQQLDIETVKNLALEYQLIKLGNIIEANDRNREIAGMTREQWEQMLAQQTLMDEKLRKDIADALALFNKDTMTAEETWKRIKDLYDSIKDKSVTVTVNYVVGSTVEGPGGSPGGGGGGGGGGGSNVVLTSPGGTEFTADQVRDQIDSLTELRKSTDAGTGINFILKEHIDELTDVLKNPTTGPNVVDERTKLAAMAAATVASNASKPTFGGGGGKYGMLFESKGGFIKPKYLAAGGFARGSDKIPAMLTPGEFVMNKYAVQSYGLDKMKAINSGEAVGDSVYNYSINVNVKSDANPDDIARAVMTHIQRVNSQGLRGVRI